MITTVNVADENKKSIQVFMKSHENDKNMFYNFATWEGYSRPGGQYYGKRSPVFEASEFRIKSESFALSLPHLGCLEARCDDDKFKMRVVFWPVDEGVNVHFMVAGYGEEGGDDFVNVFIPYGFIKNLRINKTDVIEDRRMPRSKHGCE